MAKILVTPASGTARMIDGSTYVGGHRYLVTTKDNSTVRSLLSLEKLVVLEGVSLDDQINQKTFDELVAEISLTYERKDGESGEDFYTNIARFAAESLNSKPTDGEEETLKAAESKQNTRKAKADQKQEQEPKSETE